VVWAFNFFHEDWSYQTNKILLPVDVDNHAYYRHLQEVDPGTLWVTVGHDKFCHDELTPWLWMNIFPDGAVDAPWMQTFFFCTKRSRMTKDWLQRITTSLISNQPTGTSTEWIFEKSTWGKEKQKIPASSATVSLNENPKVDLP
jgi:hypothetical protein